MSYITHRLNVSSGQKDKIRRALLDGETTLTLRFSYQDLCGGDDLIALTRTQINSVAKARAAGKGVTIHMSQRQVQSNRKVEGGFLGMLAGLATKFLPGILGSLGMGALSGAASAGIQKAIGSGLYLKKGGCVCKVTSDGKGLNIVSSKGFGSVDNGVYLKRGSQVSSVGSGLILGPNSPFKNIPILGMFL